LNELQHYRARYYDSGYGRFLSEDPIDFAGGIDFYLYVANAPVANIDSLGLAHCTFSMHGGESTGLLSCIPDKPGDSAVTIPANSGNNGDAQHHCRNNSSCPPDGGHGPLPLGWYKWGAPSVSHQASGGKHLYPQPNTGTNMTGSDGRFLTHSCPYPFGPGTHPNAKGSFCSEGCITSTPENIQKLNQLLDAEPGSVLHVVQ